MFIARPAYWVAALALAAAPSLSVAAETLELQGGFQPDPVSVEYQATGRQATADQVRGCPGFVDAGPALTVDLTQANALVHLYLTGEAAAGALVVGPDGISRCEAVDEFGITRVRLGRVMSGAYSVWPIAATAGETLRGTILFSELDIGTRDLVSLTGIHVDPALLPPLLSDVPLDPSAEPAFGRLAMPDLGTVELPLTLAGGVPADEAGSGCAGELTQTRPDVTLTLSAPEPLLAIAAAADPDTALLVITPDGATYCNDDAINYDPALVLEDAAPGDYAIWVAVYPGGAGQPATLRIGREAPDGVGPGSAASAASVSFDAHAQPALGTYGLPPAGPLELTVALAAGALAGDALDGCSGEADPSRPDAVVTLEAPEPFLWFASTSDSVDTTLVVIGPDGSTYCNDDYDGVDAGLGVSDAMAGDYAIWVGSYGGEGYAATLTVARQAGEPGQGGAGGENPFMGQPVGSAAEALEILTGALGLADVLTYQRLEETGPEGLILHGVVLRDPTGDQSPMTIGRILVSDLDLAGLSATGAPDRFSILFEDIGYTELATEGRANALPIPLLENPPPLSLAASLLPPDGDPGRRELRLSLSFDGQISLTVGGLMQWPAGASGMGPEMIESVRAQSMALELHDMGFLGAVLREMATESGESLDSVIAQSVEGVNGMLEPSGPGSPRGQLAAALAAKLQDIDRPGVVRITVESSEPSDFMTLLQALAEDSVDATLLTIDIGYQPDP